MNDFLLKRFNGPVAQAMIDGIQSSFDYTKELTSYLYTISIDTAYERELEEIGKIIGFPRPFVPNEYLASNQFTFFDDPDTVTIDLNHGFGDLAFPEIGGRFTDIDQNLVKLPIDAYRPLLKKFAYIKYNGLSIATLDNLFSLTGESYSIAWNAAHDIEVTFTPALSSIYVYVYGLIFNVFCTNPTVIIN
jgi:hypothetical protein